MTSWTQSFCQRVLASATLPTLIAATAAAAGGVAFVTWSHPESPSRPFSWTTSQLAASTNNLSELDGLQRRKQTPADEYFAKHQRMPKPTLMHANLRDLIPHNENSNQPPSGKPRKNILIVGDIHGCYDEVQALHDKATHEANDGHDFKYVLLVGDLCNKGPQSAQVIRWARTTPNVYSVRGNHDDGALATALGDERRRAKRKYQWVLESEATNDDSSSRVTLSDADVQWLAELPYTLLIPSDLEIGNNGNGLEQDVLLVHAGLLPDRPLEDQEINTMVTVREVVPRSDNPQDPTAISHFDFHERVQKERPVVAMDPLVSDQPVPWASVWKGPPEVVFGHDARRGLQQYPPHATGLDTGACYGKQLTGLVLPSRTIVSVDAHQPYEPMSDKTNKK